ncbi:MAG: CYTH domain-containing protein [Enterococcus sp.]|jgi:uncharacterized protein YjbK|nr:CYTH domain-containing protein [Enterococcus sp.]
MTEQIEIEFKTFLQKKDYLKVFEHYQLSQLKPTIQTNLYFDTPAKELRQKKYGLRIRDYETHGELTLKCPAPKQQGLLEITDPLDQTTLHALTKQSRILPTGEVAHFLKKQGFDLDSIKPFAKLTTKRYEIQLPIGLLALDESWYGKQHDYELELEVTCATQGEKDFHALLHSLAIPYHAAENKIVRAAKENQLD